MTQTTLLSSSPMNREAWLTALVAAMAPKFKELGYAMPEKVRVSCGWPSRGALAGKGGSRTIGQCFNPRCSKDGSIELFISPVLDDAMRVAGVLAHELIHAIVGTEAGHGAIFARAAKAIGLTGKMTATTESEAFHAWVAPLLEAIGPYPHASVDVKLLGLKKQTTRMVKCECSECGYVARTTRKWLEETGAPLCPCNHEEMEVKA